MLKQFVKRTEVKKSRIPELTPVNSSMISGIAYNPRTQYLTARFVKNGNVFRYANVTREVAAGIIGAESVGRAFKMLIDNPAYPCVQIGHID